MDPSISIRLIATMATGSHLQTALSVILRLYLPYRLPTTRNKSSPRLPEDPSLVTHSTRSMAHLRPHITLLGREEEVHCQIPPEAELGSN